MTKVIDSKIKIKKNINKNKMDNQRNRLIKPNLISLPPSSPKTKRRKGFTQRSIWRREKLKISHRERLLGDRVREEQKTCREIIESQR